MAASSSRHLGLTWRDAFNALYPNALKRFYCVPPLHFNRMPYSLITVPGTSQHALVLGTGHTTPQPSCGARYDHTSIQQQPQPKRKKPTKVIKCSLNTSKTQHKDDTFDADAQPSATKRARKGSDSRFRGSKPDPSEPFNMWNNEPKAGDQTESFQTSDAQGDAAHSDVLKQLFALAEFNKEVMFIISQLNFDDYLCNSFEDMHISCLPRLSQLEEKCKRGEFDVLIIHRLYGILIGEIKSVGVFNSSNDMVSSETLEAIAKKVEKAVVQLEKAEKVVRHALGDLVEGLRVRKTLFLPYVKKFTLREVLRRNDRKLEKALGGCLGVQTEEELLDRCCCCEELNNQPATRHHTPLTPDTPGAPGAFVTPGSSGAPAKPAPATPDLSPTPGACVTPGCSGAPATPAPVTPDLPPIPATPSAPAATVTLMTPVSFRAPAIKPSATPGLPPDTPGAPDAPVSFVTSGCSGAPATPGLPPTPDTPGAPGCSRAPATSTPAAPDVCSVPDPGDTASAPAVSERMLAWWSRVFACSKDPLLSDDLYIDILARFVGPATSVRVHCSVPPRMEVRTEGEAIAELGRRMTRLVVTPQQLDVINRALGRVYLSGPPGAGKTVVMVLVGLRWLCEGEDVDVFSPYLENRAASSLIHHQLTETIKSSASSSDAPPLAPSRNQVHCQGQGQGGRVGRVHLHKYDFDAAGEKEAERATTELLRIAKQRKLNILFDEAGFGNVTTQECIRHLIQDLLRSEFSQNVRLWVASKYKDPLSPHLEKECLTTPLRSAPVIVREIVPALDEFLHLESFRETSSFPSPADGPPVVTIRHQGEGHDDVTEPLQCEQCGRMVGEKLRCLGVGKKETLCENSPAPLKYSDVFILTRDTSLQDDVTDPAGTLTSPASGFLRGVRSAGIPLKVIPQRWKCGSREMWERDVADVATGQCHSVVATHISNVFGLERQIVVWLPGYDEFFDNDGRSMEKVVFGDRATIVARAIVYLIRVLTG